MNNYIAIEGLIGAGKTTLARLLAQNTGATFLGEDADVHPFLNIFFTDPPKYALETELGFLLIHYHQLFRHAGMPIVADFSLGKDLVFARMSLGSESVEIFEKLFHHLTGRIYTADRVLFLRVPVETCIERIRKRGISREQSITPAFLASLEEAYLDNLSCLGKKVEILSPSPSATPSEVMQMAVEVMRLDGVR